MEALSRLETQAQVSFFALQKRCARGLVLMARILSRLTPYACPCLKTKTLEQPVLAVPVVL